MALGIDTFILSGYPHLEEAYRFAELVFPLLPLGHKAADGAGQRSIPARSARPLPTIIVPLQRHGVSHERPRRKNRDLPRADKFIQWLVPLAIILVWQSGRAAGLIPSAGAACPDRCRRGGLEAC